MTQGGSVTPGGSVTLARAVTVRGRALFSGEPCAVTISPGGEGIVLRARGAAGAAFAASVEHLSPVAPHPAFTRMPPRNTALGAGGAVVQTVEHLLGALAGLGVTNVVCEVEGPEPPIGDGSARHFVEAMQGAGLVTAPAREPLVITEPVDLQDDAGFGVIRLQPAAAGVTRFRYELDYGERAAIPAQHAAWDGSALAFAREIAGARTYSLAHEVEAMRGLGLFASFTPRDLLVIGPDGAAIENALRWPDEPARHKLLDLIGDIALAGPGRRVQGLVTASRSGHRLAQRAAAVIAEMNR